MRKNTILVINPKNKNIIKAIFNALVINMLDIIILGNRLEISKLCEEVNLNVDLLQIIECETEQKVCQRLNHYKNYKNIKGIIFDDFREDKIIDIFNYNNICQLIDFGIFKKSVFVVKNTVEINLKRCIIETIKLIEQLKINSLNVGVISLDKQRAVMKKKWLKKEFKFRNIDIIEINKIKKCKHNLIIFDDKILENEYICKIKTMVLPRTVQIKKASNVLIFDAKDLEFKNIFIQLVLLSKLTLFNNEINSQAV